MNRKVLIICGPTATGKTSLALQLAEAFSGQLISADSRQVYKNMDIGTGKDKPQGVEILGYDLIHPDQDFSVADFVKFARQAINQLWSKNKLPIVVGGTGLYLKHLFAPAPSLFVPPDKTLRERLSSLTVKQLQLRLKKLNLGRWQNMNRSDRYNPRRLIRAIELAFQGVTLEDNLHTIENINQANQLWIGLKAPLSFLDQRINQRVLARIRQGMTQEVKALIKKYPSWHHPAFSATGYRPWRQFLEGKISKNQAINLWQLTERQYARRQLTWFKNQPQIHWFDITVANWQNKTNQQVKHWLHGPSSKD